MSYLNQSMKKNIGKLIAISVLIGSAFQVNPVFADIESLSDILKLNGDDSTLVKKQTPQLQQIGEIQEKLFELSYSETRKIKVKEPGANFLKFHISTLSLLEGDFVTIKSPSGEKHIYSSDDMPVDGSGLWTLSVEGDTAIIKLHQKGGDPSDGMSMGNVVIDQVSRGFSDEELAEMYPVQESVCGSQDWRDAKCYKNSQTTKFNKAKAVARLIITKGSGTFYCTGWRWAGRSDGVITNEHCITNYNQARNTEVQFNYKKRDCGGSNTSAITKVQGSGLLVDNGQYDVALITIRNPSRVSKFGALQVETRRANVGENIYIAHHPGGRPKKLSVNSDRDGGNCRVNASNSEVRYFCDTEGGSSGSPVILASNHKVIALHHTGGCYNSGERMDNIWPIISPYRN